MDNEHLTHIISHNKTSNVHKMEIFTSLMLCAHLTPHKADRQTDRERESLSERVRERDTEGEREMQYIAVCDGLCLHEALCDACIRSESVSLFMCKAHVP